MPQTGFVSRWNDEKGFGFIVQHNSQESIYVHRTGLVGVESLREGDEVQYDRFQDAIDVKRGKERATNVHLISSSTDGGSSGSTALHHGQMDRPHDGTAYAATSSHSRMNGYSGELPGNPAAPGGRGFGRESRPYGHEGGGCGPHHRQEDRPTNLHAQVRVEVGTVKSWNDEKKFGFIIPDRGGDSIYVHTTGLAGPEYLREGDAVEFERFQDSHDMKRGKERAVNVRLLGDSFSKTVSSVGGTAYGYSRQEIRTPPPPAPKPLIETGSVSRWNDEKGFGFIVHHATQESLYVHRTGLLGDATLQEGDEVEFERFQDARDVERGKERCVNVRILRGDSAKTSSSSTGFGYNRDDHGYARGGSGYEREDHYYGHGYGQQKQPGLPGGNASYGRSDYAYGSNRAAPYGHGASMASPAGSHPAKEVGTVMSWNDEKGFGFILFHGSKESIYMHRTGLLDTTSVVTGDTVEFERTQDQRDVERGKERAVNIRVITGGGAHGGRDYETPYQSPFPRTAPPPQDYVGYTPQHASFTQESNSYGQVDRRFGSKGAGSGYEHGTVTAWNEDKGFGFIVVDATQESIYVHRTGLLGSDSLREGDPVEFGRTQDARDLERGKQRAVNVRVLGGGGGGRGRDRSRSPRRR